MAKSGQKLRYLSDSSFANVGKNIGTASIDPNDMIKKASIDLLTRMFDVVTTRDIDDETKCTRPFAQSPTEFQQLPVGPLKMRVTIKTTEIP